MKVSSVCIYWFLNAVLPVDLVSSFSASGSSSSSNNNNNHNHNNHKAVFSRRAFGTQSTAAVAGAITMTVAMVTPPPPAVASPPQIQTTANGKIKYATLQPAKEPPSTQKGDIVAIEYTGYLTDGTIFDATHAEGKKNALMFQVGGNAVIPGVSEMVQEMGVGQKVQAIIPSELAFGEKGLCLENGECLIQPKSTLVYDISLKRSAIPPP